MSYIHNSTTNSSLSQSSEELGKSSDKAVQPLGSEAVVQVEDDISKAEHTQAKIVTIKNLIPTLNSESSSLNLHISLETTASSTSIAKSAQEILSPEASMLQATKKEKDSLTALEGKIIFRKKLSDEDRTAILSLSPMVSISRLSEFIEPIALTMSRQLKNTGVAVDSIHECLLHTLVKVAAALKETPVPSEGMQHYGKKTKDDDENILTYPFTITSKGELLISTDKLGSGSSKKISYAINMTAGKVLVKSTIESKVEIDKALKEVEVHYIVAKDNPDVHQPLYLSPMTKYKFSNKDADGNKTGDPPLKKLMFYDRLMDKDARSLNKEDVQSLFTAGICLTRGLAKMHEDGFVHLDVKLANIFGEDLSQGIIKIADFGYTRKIGERSAGGSNTAPEVVKLSDKTNVIAATSHDDYAAGIALMEMITGNSFTTEYDEYLLNKEFDELVADGNQYVTVYRNMNPELQETYIELLDNLLDPEYGLNEEAGWLKDYLNAAKTHFGEGSIQMTLISQSLKGGQDSKELTKVKKLFETARIPRFYSELENDEQTEVIDLTATMIKKMTHSDIRLEYMKIALKMLEHDPKKRMTCHDAFEELSKVKLNYFST